MGENRCFLKLSNLKNAYIFDNFLQLYRQIAPQIMDGFGWKIKLKTAIIVVGATSPWFVENLSKIILKSHQNMTINTNAIVNIFI